MGAPDMTVTTGTTDWVGWAAAGRPFPGETSSGDGYIVLPQSLRTLIAVMDGLGHGTVAHEATVAAIATIAAIPDEPLRSFFERCNDALRRTRGVVMTIASIAADGQLEWMGVGNVEGILVRSAPPRRHERVVTHGGVVGYRLPSLYTCRASLATGDLLVMATDGIRSDFVSSVDPALSPRAVAARILEEHSRGYDDALVVVARYDGGPR
jgi:negative regulator of sigma-B (phosphoserine phosphatase)